MHLIYEPQNFIGDVSYVFVCVRIITIILKF